MNKITYHSDWKKFYFENYTFDLVNLEAKFIYSFDRETYFEEVISFDDPNFDLRSDLDFEILDNLLFHLHMALGISYYKAYPTSKLIVDSWYLDSYQVSFWKKFYKNWLWEFLFINKIFPENLFHFESNHEKKLQKKDFLLKDRALVAIGWGKDSLVSMELFKKAWIGFDTFVFGKTDSIKESCINIIWKNNFLVTRKISQKLFELNESWYFNGHVPITWIIAFAMEVIAYLYDYKYLVLSNERSANFWNTEWEWVDVNHQYSKSLEFEEDFALYVQKYISSDVKYFSLLRWMYEFKIAELFTKLWTKYFQAFSSCNNNFKIHNTTKAHQWIWCNNCPKCAFVFSILRPFINKQEVIDIFWEDLYQRKDLEKLFKELLGVSWMKPFECVWTNEEVILAMKKTIENTCYNETPYILRIFIKEVDKNMKKNDYIKIENKLLKVYDEDIIPAEIKTKIDFYPIEENIWKKIR